MVVFCAAGAWCGCGLGQGAEERPLKHPPDFLACVAGVEFGVHYVPARVNLGVCELKHGGKLVHGCVMTNW